MSSTKEQNQMEKLTKQEQRIYDVLQSGEQIRKEDLHKLLWDELASMSALHVTIHNLRKKLVGQTIISIREDGVTYFQLKRKLVNPNSGKR